MPHWYATLGGDPQEIRIVLLEQTDEILADDINAPMCDRIIESLKQRQVSVEPWLECLVTKVEPDRIRYKHNDAESILETETLLWVAGVRCHPLIEALSVEDANRDRLGRVKVTPTLQLPGFPEVFAGGDCAAEADNLLPPLAEVAYQEGGAIADNLKAISQGKSPTPSEVNLRGSLLKLGLQDSAAHLFNRFKVTGHLGHLIRQGTYLELLPTPGHNFQVTTEWLIDEIFQRYSTPLAVGESGAPT
ncbi:NAD(P)/FAD-dependent oxidoreductase [Phormidium sp. CCY1219]|uniref:NAD(P)/FAD-dependent oxidoreductase n=1 Tax=Phormidium sp. CCY1219 TaxID=2886104 RepID=UPI002D79E852|nr:FAD-dependent oxidoreductase [Phormidium sp. CCY1219]